VFFVLKKKEKKMQAQTAEELRVGISRAYQKRISDKAKIASIQIKKKVVKRESETDEIVAAVHAIVLDLKNHKSPEVILTYGGEIGVFKKKGKEALDFLQKEQKMLSAMIDNCGLKPIEQANFKSIREDYRACVISTETQKVEPLGKGNPAHCKISGMKPRAPLINVVVKLTGADGAIKTQQFKVHKTWANRLHHWFRVASMTRWLYMIPQSGERSDLAEAMIVMALKNSFQFLTKDLIGTRGRLNKWWFQNERK
jgi:hypothetical protein